MTIPHKESVLPLLDKVDPLAAKIGAVDTIVHRDDYLYGYNTDAPGLLYALHEHGVGTLHATGQSLLEVILLYCWEPVARLAQLHLL